MDGLIAFSKKPPPFAMADDHHPAAGVCKLGRGNLNRYFPFGGYGSDSENRTQLVCRAAERGSEFHGGSISPDNVYVIGDTPRDIDAGREGGFQTVGVATGKYSREELKAAGATLAISDFDRDSDEFLRLIY